jgi:hypothetical protein
VGQIKYVNARSKKRYKHTYPKLGSHVKLGEQAYPDPEVIPCGQEVLPCRRDQPVYGERQMIKILDGNPVLKLPFVLLNPPHDAIHMFGVVAGAGYEDRRKGVDPSKGH